MRERCWRRHCDVEKCNFINNSVIILFLYTILSIKHFKQPNGLKYKSQDLKRNYGNRATYKKGIKLLLKHKKILANDSQCVSDAPISRSSLRLALSLAICLQHLHVPSFNFTWISAHIAPLQRTHR